MLDTCLFSALCLVIHSISGDEPFSGCHYTASGLIFSCVSEGRKT